MVVDELATSFSRFANSSQIRHPKLTTILVWSIGIIILTCMTFIDIGPLLDQYHNNNVAPKVRVVAGNQTIKPPPMTYCIPRSPFDLGNLAAHLYSISRNETHISSCVECQKMADHSWDVWTKLNISEYRTLGEYHQALSAAISTKFLSEGNLAVLSLNNSDWNRPILDAAWDLLDCISDLDSSLEQVVDEQWSGCFGEHRVGLALSTRAMEYVYNRILDVICIHLKFRYRGGAPCQRLLATTPGVFFLNLFCLKLPMIQNGSHSQFFSVIRNVTWPAAIRGVDPFYVDAETNMLTWPRSEGNMVFVSDPTNPAFRDDAEERAFLKYFVVLTVAEKRRDKPCYNESGPVVCRGNCMVAKIVRQCMCIPFTFRKDVQGNRNLPYCTPDHYSSCNFSKSVEEEDCEYKCDNPCEYVAYQWHVTRAIVPPRYDNRVFSLYVAPLFSPFVEFTVEKKDTPEQFFSQVAAVFNLYLGVSGLSAIAVLVGCIELMKKWYKSRRQGSAKINRQTSIIQSQESEVDGVRDCGLTRISLASQGSLNLGLTGADREVEMLKLKLEDAAKCNNRLKQQAETQAKCLMELTLCLERVKKSKMHY